MCVCVSVFVHACVCSHETWAIWEDYIANVDIDNENQTCRERNLWVWYTSCVVKMWKWVGENKSVPPLGHSVRTHVRDITQTHTGIRQRVLFSSPCHGFTRLCKIMCMMTFTSIWARWVVMKVLIKVTSSARAPVPWVPSVIGVMTPLSE